MPTALTGNAAAFNRGAAIAATGPADGEAIDAVDVNAPTQILLDACEDYRTQGDKLDAAQTIVAAKTYQLATEANAHRIGAEPTTRRFLEQMHLTGTTGTANVYHAADLEFVINATWSNNTSEWTQTDGAKTSQRIRIRQDGFVSVDHQIAAAAPWAEGAWFANRFLVDGGTGDTTAVGTVTGESVTASTGDVKASAGKLQAQGNPTNDEARVEFKQLAPKTAAKPTVTRAAGVTGDTVNNDSTDFSGAVTLTSAAGVGPAQLATINFDKAYPAAPFPVIAPIDAISAAAGLNVRNRTVNGFDVYGTIGAGATVGFNYHVG